LSQAIESSQVSRLERERKAKAKVVIKQEFIHLVL